MATIFFSIVLPIFDKAEGLSATVDSLSQQRCDFEVIVAKRGHVIASIPPVGRSVEIVKTQPDLSRGALLNAGAAKATGDVLLFLWPGTRLPDDGLQAIETNFRLLPQSIGGNFHVKHDDPSLFSQGLQKLLKRWRYRGRYFGSSAIFVQKETFGTLAGFRDYDLLEDYDFAQRLEKQGATLFLPNYVTAPARSFKDRKVRATIAWMVIYPLYQLGVSPNHLATFYYD